jgi:hypothetical protein
VALAVLAALGLGLVVDLARGEAGPDPGAEPAQAAQGAAHGSAHGAAAAQAAPAEPPVDVSAVVSTGEFAAHPGTGPVVGSGRVVRYRVEVETGVPVPVEQFAAEVDEALQDPRGWTTADRISVQRTDSTDASVTVTLASPGTTDRLCRPLRTNGRFSCFNGGRAVINSDRWLLGADTYAGDLAAYRAYVVNHEVGHSLGHGHRGCPAPGAPAPVMVQQTKSLYGCAPNPWPAAAG